LSAFGFQGTPDVPDVMPEPLTLPAPGKGANSAADPREKWFGYAKCGCGVQMQRGFTPHQRAAVIRLFGRL
jgi:hypothetical protein